MEKLIYDLLSFIKNNNRIPTPDDLKINNNTLNTLVKKCISDGLLDKKIIYVNILGQIQCDEFPELAITINGYNYLKNNNPLGNLQ